MKKMLAVLVILLFNFANAAEVVSTAPSPSDIRCEKLTGNTLSEFKEKLVENCDLNKPFSSSLSRVLNDDTYFYCCQLKKK